MHVYENGLVCARMVRSAPDWWYVQSLLKVMVRTCGDSYSILTPPTGIFLMFGEIREIPDRYQWEVYENISDARSTRTSYGVDLLLSSASLFLRLFSPHTNKCLPGDFIGEPAPLPNTLFVYPIVLFYLRYLPSLKISRENVLQGRYYTSSWCSHLSRNCFWGLLRFRVAKGRVYWNCDFQRVFTVTLMR